MTSAETGCLHQLFEAQAAQAGERTALTDGVRTYTYEELNRAANRLARRLRRSGAGPDTLVGVCCDRSADSVIATLAVLKSGAAYLPLDPDYPAQRLHFMLSDSRCHLVVGHDRYRGLFENCDIAYLAAESAVALDEPEDNPCSEAHEDHPAYVIYTSGSTGTPKGVVVTHRNVVRLFEACRSDLSIERFDSNDVWTLFHSMAFDFSVWELWGALLHGGRLVIVPYRTSRSPESFLRLLIAERVTVLNQTPTAFQQLVRAAEVSDFPSTDLRLVIFGGEALNPRALRPWIERYGDARPRLVNMYGITETTVHVTMRRLLAADCESSRSLIGAPLPDLRLHILDADMLPVRQGEVGEIFVGGPGVTRGYLGQPALTAQRYVPDPFGRPGDRLYRSGDLAVVGSDGELEFRGRSDQQVKLQGFRIELGEIEATMAKVAWVREATVVLREDVQGELALVGYVVPAPGAVAAVDDLRGALAESLPAHMIPSAFVALDAFPLTANGKLDRKALPAPTWVNGRQSLAVSSGRTLRAILREIWAEVLGQKDIGPDDNFFVLGGDSIVAVRVAGMAREAGLRLKIEDIFRCPTLSELAQACEVAHDADADGALISDNIAVDPVAGGHAPADIQCSYPMTSLQLGMVYESLLSQDPTLYHDLATVRIHGQLDLDALRRVLRRTAARHEVLRTSFDLGGYGEPLQLVHTEPAVEPLVQVQRLPRQAPYEAFRRWWRQEWQSPFDFGSAPLWRCHVHHHADGAFQLSVSAHHSILDGWSFSLLLTELVAEYDRELRGLPALDEPPPPPFRAYVDLERTAIADRLAADYWTDVVRTAEPLELTRPEDPAAEAAMDPDMQMLLASGLVDEARRQADCLGLPVKSVFLAVHMWALRAATGAKDITTGLVTAGRPEAPGSASTLGLFLNSVPVRTVFDGGTWQDLARAVFAAERALMPFRRFPLSRITDLAGGRPPFSVLFNYTDFTPFDALSGLERISVSDWWFSDRTNIPVVVEVGRRPMSNAWELTARAEQTRAASAFCKNLTVHFLDGLNRFCDNPSGAC